MLAEMLSSMVATALAVPLLGQADVPDDLRLNQVQVIGTHNSYHVAADPAVMGLIAAVSDRLAEGLDYSHRPLAEQFGELNIRQIELDVFADPDGGLFARPMARKTLTAAGKDPGPDPNEGGVLDPPGFKVLHVPDIDYRTTAPTFENALIQVRDWSRRIPIMCRFSFSSN